MSEVSSGAEVQVHELRQISDALHESAARRWHPLRGRRREHTGGVDRADIDDATPRDRARARHSHRRKHSVDQATREVSVAQRHRRRHQSLRRDGEPHRRADQPARAQRRDRGGARGTRRQGFAVVADEVRKLAEQAQGAADEIVHAHDQRHRPRHDDDVARWIESSTRVGEIERISKDIDDALTTIAAAAERTRVAPRRASRPRPRRTCEVVSGAAESITSVARTAEGHASAAEQVSAATQEQSAACEQMSSASAELLEGSSLLRELVKGLRVDELKASAVSPEQHLAALDFEAKRAKVG